MKRLRLPSTVLPAFTLLLATAGCAPDLPPGTPVVSLDPAALSFVGDVDERYQSYNVEMLEVTGGEFWRPYDNEPEDAGPADSAGTPAGMPRNLYAYRPPIDLSNPRLRSLARGLAPAYMRVSGTWANRTYVPAAGEIASDDPPEGFGGVLTPEQWEGVVAFSQAVDAPIVTSFAVGTGVRDADGVWTPAQAQRLLDLTAANGGALTAAEFFNEPNIAALGGAPAGYTAADYGRDFRIFHDFIRAAAPELTILGPGSVMETTGDWLPAGRGGLAFLSSEQLLSASGDASVDALSYHHYGALSQRCAAMGIQITPEEALSEAWLRRTDESLAAQIPLRDRYAPGVSFWLTETADAACGGNPWGSAFLDTFRYLDQLGRLAKQEVAVVMHNTLAASDYGLLDEDTIAPKPNYWGAFLWQRLMGATVLDSGVEIQEGRHLYAHCLPNTPGGVALLVINNSRTDRWAVDLPVRSDRYTLSADSLLARDVSLNGRPLRLGADDTLPELIPDPVRAGAVLLEPTTITFLALAEAGNPACR